MVPASAAALMQQLAGQGRLAADALNSLDPPDRDAFAAGLYRALTNHAPAVTGLLRLPPPSGTGAGNLTLWFAEQLAAGQVPPPGAWLAAAGGEQNLLTRAANQEPAVLAAAAAALAASVGSDAQAQTTLADEFLALPDPSQQALQQVWTQRSHTMLLPGFADVGGRYRLVISVAGSPFTAPPDPADNIDALIAALRGNVIDLGELRLQADTRGVAAVDPMLTLGIGQAEGMRTLTLQQPAELAAIQAATDRGLGMEHLQPIRLAEAHPGLWWGTFTTVGGQQAQMLMVRAGD
jgi:hypothetical protein